MGGRRGDIDLDALTDETYEMVMSNQEDWRSETLNELLLRLYGWCNVRSQEDIEALDCVVTSSGPNITNFRFFIDQGILTVDGTIYWAANYMTLRFTTDSSLDEEINWTKRKTFRFKDYRLNYKKMGKWFKKWLHYYEGYTRVRRHDLVKILKVELDRTKDLTPDKYIDHSAMYDAMLNLLVFSDRKKNLRHDKTYLNTLTLLLKGLMESDEREKFIKYLQDEGILRPVKEVAPPTDEDVDKVINEKGA